MSIFYTDFYSSHPPALGAPFGAGGSLDQVTGAVHLRQLIVAGDDPVSTVALEIPMFPDSAKALRALRQMQAGRVQMALVVGRTTVVHEADGTIVLPGRFPIRYLPGIGVELPDGDDTTIAGLVLDQLGNIPAPGDEATIDGWRLQVRAMRGRAITEISLSPTEGNLPDIASPTDVAAETGGESVADQPLPDR